MELIYKLAAIQDFLSLLNGVRPNGDGFVARCPAHDDRQQSLSVSEGDDGRILVKCFAGCETVHIVEAVGLKMKDLFAKEPQGFQDDTASSHSAQPAPTITSLAANKGLPADFLSQFLEPMPFGVKILYKLSNGKLAPRQRLRIAHSAKDGSKWTKGEGSIIIYGSWRNKEMAEKSNAVLFVEGESDAWTAWYHDIAALGVPGADMAGKLQKQHIKPYKTVYLWKEPDRGGETFIEGMSTQLAELQYEGEVFIIQGPPGEDGRPVKDLNQLHKNTLLPGYPLSSSSALFKEIWQAILSAAVPVDLAKVNVKAKKSAASSPSFDPLDPSFLFKNLTDMGNADRLVSLFGQDILFCYLWKQWLIWNGAQWKKDDTGEIDRKAEATVRSIYVEAANEPDKELRFELLKHAKKSEASYQIKAMLERAKNRRPATPEQFDNNTWLFNVQNGTINLKTGELKPHTRDDLITKISPAPYDPDADAPVWNAFLRRVTKDNQGLVAFLQRAAGYALTGDTSEHCLFFLHGDGRNGKSVFVEALEYIVGDYGSVARPELLMAKKQGDTIPNEIAALSGVRYVSTTETEGGKRMAESMLKQWTGGDTVSARFLHAEFFNFKPQFKIFLASNHKPIIRGQDTAIWERIYLIPFTAYIPPAERDKKLGEKLQKEAAGILKWAVEGCLAWQRDGLNPPDIVKAATEEYKSEMDVLSDFIADRCIIQSNAIVSNSKLWSAYIDWCKDNGEKYTISRRDFKISLERRKIFQKKSGIRFWQGIGLLSEVEGQQYSFNKTANEYGSESGDNVNEYRDSVERNITCEREPGEDEEEFTLF